MKFFSHKGFLQKMIIAMLCIIILFNFIVPNLATVSIADDSEASTEDDDQIIDPEDGIFGNIKNVLSDTAGAFMTPFTALINFIADTIASIVQGFMMHNAEPITTPNVDHYAKTDVTDPAEADVRIYKKYNLLGTSYPNFTFSCEEIFANKVPMLDVNFLNPSITDLGDTEVNEKHNIASRLQNIIKAWYRVLRMIAIVGLLSVLIYIGIRIMIDSNLENKAKYKERLLDWLVAFVILFSMHYIMSFVLTMGEELTDLFTGDNEETRNIVVYYDKGANIDIGPLEVDNRFFKTNLIGLARFKVQNDNIASKFAYEVIYIALLWFTIKFAVVYLKRVMYMAFLTIISPIIAFTYPIDKMHDGSAQGFQMWIKEYIFNALLQPFHYLLYTILVSSAISLAASNPLYAIVALFFISEAEKFLKQIFGFNKATAGTVGGMSSFATGALSSMVISNMKKGGALLGKEHGSQSDLNISRLPTMNKDKDISNGDESNDWPADDFARRMSEDEMLKEQLAKEKAEELEKARQEAIKAQQEREREERERNMQQQQMQIQQQQMQMQQQQRSIDEHQKQIIRQRQEEHEERRENEQQGINEGENVNNNQQQSGTQLSNSNRNQSRGNNANRNTAHTPLNDYFVPVGENFIQSSVNDFIDSNDFVPPFVEEDENLSPASIEDYVNSDSFIPFEYITNGEGDTENYSQEQGNSNSQSRGNLPLNQDGLNNNPATNNLLQGQGNNNSSASNSLQGQRTANNNPPTSINLANSLRNANRNNNMWRQRGNSSSGVKRVLKSAIKPIWDTDKSVKSNGKRYLKRYFQLGMGAATAMVEMGASITDGKFSPAESLVSFVAGAKGGGIAWDNVKNTKDNYKNAYREGVYGVDEAAAMNYIEKWNDDDDINKFYKDNYKDDYKDYKQMASDELLTRGIKDVEEQKQCFKYADHVKKEMQNSWENNERQVIMQQHQDYTDVQVEQELENRKQIQADQIRGMLGKNKRQMSNDQAIQRAFMPQATKEAVQALKLRKKAAAKDALIDPDRKTAFKKQQVRALQNKPENANRPVEQLERDVDIAFNKVDKFDEVNDM